MLPISFSISQSAPIVCAKHQEGVILADQRLSLRDDRDLPAGRDPRWPPPGDFDLVHHTPFLVPEDLKFGKAACRHFNSEQLPGDEAVKYSCRFFRSAGPSADSGDEA